MIVGTIKKRREYVPREIWNNSQANVKQVPKRKIIPVNRPESQKYSTTPRNGMFSKDSVSVPHELLKSPEMQVLLQNVVDNLQASLSTDTWSNYNTAVNNLVRCGEYLNMSMELPLDEIRLVLYVAYLLKIRGVLPSTVGSYISGLRIAHWAKGFTIPTLRSPFLNQILKGATNLKNLSLIHISEPTRPY